MKKLLLLLCSFLFLGGSNSWADPTTLYEKGTTGHAWASADLEDWTFVGSDGQEINASGYLRFYKNTVARTEYSSTHSLTTTDGYVVTMNLLWNVENANGSATAGCYVKFGDVTLFWCGQNRDLKITIGSTETTLISGGNTNLRGTDFNVEISINKTTNGVKYSISNSLYNSGTPITGSGTSATGDVSNVIFGWWRGGQQNASSQIVKSIVVTEEEYSVPTADYTVKYVSTISAVETEIKSNVSRKGEVDATVTLDASDKNTITYGGHQYYYVSDNASTSTINNDNSTVVKVVFVQATFDNGDYYFKNKSNGAYFAAGNNWGTHAVSNMQGHVTAFTVQPGGKYHIDTHISNGGNSHYLNGEYTDGAAQEWAIASDGAGYYTINNGSGNLTAGAVGENLTVGASTGDNAKWTILTATEWKADQEARLAGATAASGEDATFYIAAPNFPRNDNAENAKWQGGPNIAGYQGVDGNGINYNGQKFTNPYATFDVYQALTGVKPGAYKLTAQGFYRNGLNNASDANDNLAKLYANSSEVALKNIRYYGYTDDSHSAEGFTTDKSGIFVPDNQSDAGLAFNANKFENELYVVVGEDGNLRVGVKKDAATGPNQDWAVFDNFKLTYYGNTVTATIGAEGYATFGSQYPLDLENLPSGLEAFKATGVNGSNYVVFQGLNTAVAANTGLLLKGTGGTTYNIPVAASGETVTGNLLFVNASGEEFTPESGYSYYGLVKDSKTFASFAPKNVAIPANKAYLKIAETSARTVLYIEEDDAPTAINAIEAAETEGGALKDGKYLIGNKIVLVKNGVKYSANGQKLN